MEKLARIFTERQTKSQRETAEETGIARGTIKRYEEAYEQLSELEKAEFGQMMTGYRIRKILDDNRKTAQV
jgi:response regulator of citrate/malate metabolism